MDSDDKRKENILYQEEIKEDHARTVAGTGWHDHYTGQLATFPGAGRPPVTMLAGTNERVLIREERWVPAHLLTPLGDNPWS
ncbi:hypothetical protein ACXM2N_03375 [Corynebacterium sp. ZY180755]